MNWVVSPVLILAQVEAAREAAPLWVRLVVSVLPWLLLLVVLWLVIWLVIWRPVSRQQRSLTERSFEHIERAFAHMERIEAKTDEMIGLLRQISDKLDARRG